MQTYETLRTMTGRGTPTHVGALTPGQVIRTEGMRYRVQHPPVAMTATGSIAVEVYSEDNQHDTFYFGPARKDRRMSDTFTLTIRLGNAEMQTNEDVADALVRTARKVAVGAQHGAIFDLNGNGVGGFEFPRDYTPRDQEDE